MIRFQFSIIIPGDIAPHDGFKTCPGRIKQDVYAKISGLELAGLMSAPNTSDVSVSVSTTPSGASVSITTPSKDTASNTSYAPHADFESAPDSSSALRSVPKGVTMQPTIKLQDTVKASRRVRVRYNPNRDGGFSQLDDISSAHVPGIGFNELHMVSDVVSSRSQRLVCIQ